MAAGQAPEALQADGDASIMHIARSGVFDASDSTTSTLAGGTHAERRPSELAIASIAKDAIRQDEEVALFGFFRSDVRSLSSRPAKLCPHHDGSPGANRARVYVTRKMFAIR